MREICEEFVRFHTNQSFADQVQTIIKKRWFSDFGILEIHQQINWGTCQQDPNTVTETLNTEKLEPSNRIEMQSYDNQNSKHNRTNTNSRRKNECRDYEENYVRKEDLIVISQG